MEISQKVIIDMAADRGAYICQSQSLNIFMENANFGKLTSMHFYSWKAGLKTGMYYLRTKAATDAIKFTVDKSKLAQPAVAEASVSNGIAVGSTVMLEPVMSGPTTTRVMAPVEARVAQPLSEAGHRVTASEAKQEANELPMSAVEMQNAERMNVLSKQAEAQAQIACSLEDPEGCEACSG